jgi:hypothetical protein
MRYLFILALVVLIGCSNDSDPAADKASFTRIYDNNKFNALISLLILNKHPMVAT